MQLIRNGVSAGKGGDDGGGGNEMKQIVISTPEGMFKCVIKPTCERIT